MIKLRLIFYDGLSVITGETGAGKSILLGALGLILGNRADHSILKDSTKKCVVEGSFSIKNYSLKYFFEKHNLDYADDTILRREITGSGKSRSFINDTPCTLEIIKEIGVQLIDIHSQQQSLQINDASFQLKIIDALAGNQDLLVRYQSNFKRYDTLRKEIESFQIQLAEAKQKEDYLKFQFEELSQLNLKADENESLEQEQQRFANSEDILRALSLSQSLLAEKEDNIVDQVSSLKQSIAAAERYDQGFSELLIRVNSTLIELQDISAELEDKAQLFEYDEERHQFVEERLSEIHRIQKKHMCTHANELLDIQENIDAELLNLSHSDATLDKLNNKLVNTKSTLDEISESLSRSRLSVLHKFSSRH